MNRVDTARKPNKCCPFAGAADKTHPESRVLSLVFLMGVLLAMRPYFEVVGREKEHIPAARPKKEYGVRGHSFS